MNSTAVQTNSLIALASDEEPIITVINQAVNVMKEENGRVYVMPSMLNRTCSKAEFDDDDDDDDDFDEDFDDFDDFDEDPDFDEFDLPPANKGGKITKEEDDMFDEDFTDSDFFNEDFFDDDDDDF